MSTPSSKREAGSEARADWKSMRLWQIQPLRDALIIIGAIGLVYLGYVLSLVTIPILLALLLAYLFEPLVARVTRTGLMSRAGAAIALIGLSATVVILPLVLGVGFAGAQAVKYGQEFATDLDVFVRSVEAPENAEILKQVPEGSWRKLRQYVIEQNRIYKENQERRRLREAAGTPVTGQPADVPTTVPPAPLPRLIPSAPREQGPSPAVMLPDGTNGELPGSHSVIDAGTFSASQIIQPIYTWLRANTGKIGSEALAAGGGAVSWVAKGVGSAWVILFGLFLTSFFFFFFSTSYGAVLAFWRSLIPERRKNRVLELLSQMDRVISGFVRGRMTIAFVMMIMYSLGYLLIGVPAWLVLGPIVGLATIVPYLSSVIGIPIAMLLLALEPSHGTFLSAWWWVVFAPIGVSLVCQGTDDYVLNPRIQGKTTNMDTPSILFASLAGGILAGFYGLLLAIPVAACLRILLREVFWPRFRKWAQGRAKDFLPIEHES